MARRLEAMGQEKYAGTAERRGKIDVFTGKIAYDEKALTAPLRWKKPRRIFVNSMSDLFHEAVPFEFIDRVFAVMNATMFQLPIREDARDWHTYQVLTKRPERMAEYMLSRSSRNFKPGEHPIFAAGRNEGGVLRGQGLEVMNAGAVLSWPPSNVWLGTSVEDQQRANERIPHLLRTPAAVRFLSCEPLLAAVDLTRFGFCGGAHPRPVTRREDGWLIDHENETSWHPADMSFGSMSGIKWVIVGGESGPHARACDVQWVWSIVEQCKAASVPVFVKQLGSRPGFHLADEEVRGNNTPSFHHFDKASGLHIKAMKDKKGGDPDEWPEELRVREFPAVEAVAR
jgi:protein gp37